MLFGGIRNTDATVTIVQAMGVARNGWFCFAEDRLKNGSSPDQSPFIANYSNGARLRWRGADAAGAGTAFRNRHWNTAFANAKQVPIAFKANPAVAGVTYPELESVERGVARGVVMGGR